MSYQQLFYKFISLITSERYMQEPLIQYQKQDNPKNPQKQDQNHYDDNFYYIAGLIGVTVGYGSFWRFPALIYENGGGVFLVPYTLALLFFGLPLLYLETLTGQMTQCSLPLGLARINKGLKYLGVAILLSTYHGSGYYNIALVYSLRFMFSALLFPLPYRHQSPEQNTYFIKEVLGKSSSISQFGYIHWDLYFLFALSMFACYFFIRKGVKNTQKYIVFTALSPYVMFIILLLNAFRLDGSLDGLTYLFNPRWQFLLKLQIWIDAVVQVIFQLNVGLAIVYNFSSMKKINFKIKNPIYIILFSVVLCGFLAAANIFMYLSHLCHEQNMKIEDLSVDGPEISFNVFPKALSILPLPNVWILIFFFTMVMLGFDTQFGSLEAISCFLKDELKKPLKIKGFQLTLSRAKKLMIAGILLIWAPFLTSSSGIYYVPYLDTFSFNMPLILNVIIEVYIFVYWLPMQELQKIAEEKTGEHVPYWIKIILKSRIFAFVLILLLIIITFDTLMAYKQYSLGYFTFGLILSTYPYWIAYFYWRAYKEQSYCITYQGIIQKDFTKIQEKVQMKQISL